MNNNLKENTAVIKRLAKEFFNNKFVAVLIIICFIVSTTLVVAAPELAGKIMTEIYAQLRTKLISGTSMTFVIINKMLILLIVIYAIQFIMEAIKNSLIVSMWQEYMKKLREKINEKMFKRPIKYFEKTTNGAILSLLINDQENVNGHFGGIFRNVFTEIFNVIGATIMMAIISPALAVVNILMAISCVAITKATYEVAEKHFLNKQEQLASMSSMVEELYTSKQTIQAYSKEKFFAKEFQKETRELRKKTIRSNFIASFADRIFALCSNVTLAIIIVGTAMLNIRGIIEIGAIYTIMNYAKLTTNALKNLSGITNEILDAMVSLKRIYDYIDIEEETNELNKLEVKNNIIAKNISFGHNDNQMVINNINVSIKKGQKIGIVGKTGSGKTTLANLLMKVYDVPNGKLYGDDIPYDQINTEYYNKNFSYIEQNINGFEESVIENIKYGNDSITKDEIISLAKEIGIHDIIETLPEGYETIVDSKVPIGIKQLIILMQNLIAATNVLVLDEATNRLDNITEERINDVINRIAKKKMVVIIAHELDTIKDADWIYVLDDGKIVEEGTHNELVKNAKKYRELFAYSI